MDTEIPRVTGQTCRHQLGTQHARTLSLRCSRVHISMYYILVAQLSQKPRRVLNVLMQL